MTAPENDPATLQDVYNDERHFTISAFWDAGFTWDYESHASGACETYAEAVDAIISEWRTPK